MTVEPSFFDGRALQSPDDSLGFLLWRATHSWQRFLEQRLAPYGLTHLRWALLVGLAWSQRNGDSMSQRRLAEFLDMQPMQVSQVLTAMEKVGLIERQPSATDRRALDLALTPGGVALLRETLPVVENAHRDFFGSAGAPLSNLREQLLVLLDR